MISLPNQILYQYVKGEFKKYVHMYTYVYYKHVHAYIRSYVGVCIGQQLFTFYLRSVICFIYNNYMINYVILVHDKCKALL